MDFSMYGKWAWWIALVVFVLLGLLAGLGLNLSLPTIVTDILVLLAILGGLFYLAGMKDRTGFFITVLVLAAAAAASAGWAWFGIAPLAGLVSGILGGASTAATAGAAGALFMVIYEWIMGMFSSK